MYKQKQYIRWFLLGILSLSLSACSVTEAPQPGSAPELDFITSVDLEPDMTQADLEARYGGDVILFDATEGFAVLGFRFTDMGLSTLSLETSPNQDTFGAPELSAQGVSAWAGGVRAWAGGVSAWAGGVSAWAGGVSAWAGGEQTGTPLDNFEAWEQIGLYEAHTKLAPNLGENIVVAVIDTGIDLEHPVFTDRLVSGWDFIDNDALPQEEGKGANYGHGTAVAGVVLQVAPLAKVMPLRILDSDGVGDTDDLILAIDWAINNGADVINISLGSTEASKPVERVLMKAKNNEVAVVASAGNSGDDNVTFPANRAVKGDKFKKVLVSVGSVNADDEKSTFSTYDKDGVETVAPGESVLTTYPDEQVIYWSGTSFAAPMVSGALALALGEPTLDKKVKELPELVTEKVMDKLYDIRANEGNVKDGLGKGRLDLREFLDDVLK